MDQRIEKLAKMMVNYSCEIKPGEHVMIRYDGEETIAMVTALVRCVYAAGAFPYLVRSDKRLQREVILQAGDSQLEMMCKHELAIAGEMDCFLSVHAAHNAFEFSDIPAEKMDNYFKRYAMPTVLQRMKRDRWAGINYPCASEAQALGVSQQAYEDFFFDVCTMDYPRMKEAARPLAALMDKTDAVHIIGQGTDLTFSIKNIGSKICAGDHNIPDGEVFTAPVIDSVNGTITYNTANVIDGYCYDKICLTFENGRITDIACSDNSRLTKKFDADPGARYIGEFALGFNPYITKPMKNTAFDEKIAGSFHLTPGMSFEKAGNGNESSIHCDLVCIQTPEYGGGEIWFDGVLIRKDGMFVIPELEGLNPENLK
ncbi:MAG: aminopeptidase [Oscillibacter sp.]|nr:aminopeptidase [Oscillibacter sp.]